jgi:uncharacterized membrane-anchored protein
MTPTQAPTRAVVAPPSAPSLLSRVPEVTAAFWLTKVLTTGMGETTSDYLVHRFNPYVAVAFGAAGLAVALPLQLRARRYVPWAYWLTVVMVAVFGTMAADFLHIVVGVPYVASTALYAAALAGVFVAWKRSEGSLSIHSIFTLRRELFYWATVGATFALGTATGDLAAHTLHLGYFTSGWVFAGLIAVPAVANRWFGLRAIPAFWAAYILTRPLGASFADWVGVSHARGGLALGTGLVSLVLAGVIAALVAYLTARARAHSEPRPVPATTSVR